MMVKIMVVKVIMNMMSIKSRNETLAKIYISKNLRNIVENVMSLYNRHDKVIKYTFTIYIHLYKPLQVFYFHPLIPNVHEVRDIPLQNDYQ